MLSEFERNQILDFTKQFNDGYFELKKQIQNGVFDSYDNEQLAIFLLTELIYHKKKKVRENALQIAMNLKTSDYFYSHFQILMQSENGGYRNVAIAGLESRGGDPRAIQILIQVAKQDKVTPNRTAALETLALCGDESIIDALDEIILIDHHDDGRGHTPSSLAKWAKQEIINRVK
jgi:HEAT repeat protein